MFFVLYFYSAVLGGGGEDGVDHLLTLRAVGEGGEEFVAIAEHGVFL